MTNRSLVYDPLAGTLAFKDGVRNVMLGSGAMVSLLPTVYSWDAQELTFPDPSGKDWSYFWVGFQDYQVNPSGPDGYHQTNQGRVGFTRSAEEVENAVTLMAAPDGADFFLGQVRLSRTTAPSHTWWDQALGVLVPEDDWIGWEGSGMLEAALGITRLMHLVIEGGDLKLIAQQSVGPTTGNLVSTFGDANPFPPLADGEGGYFEVGDAGGFLAWVGSSDPYYKNSAQTVTTDSLSGAGQFRTHERTGSDPCSIVDPTDYTSVYSIDIRGQFGRRS